jgi:thiol-disulfide isomerase/thioredoxin
MNMPVVHKMFRMFKPWLLAIVFILVLRYTNLLSAVTDFAGNTMLKTGLMDYKPEVLKKENFDYNFSIKDMKGNKIDFNQYKGKVIFLNLWATWCGPCRYEMPSIQSLYSSIGTNDSIVFIMLSMDRDADRGKVAKYIEDKQFSLPVFMPSGNLSMKLQEVNSIPTTFIISADGKIASKKVGAVNYDTDKFRKYLNELAAEAKPK